MTLIVLYMTMGKRKIDFEALWNVHLKEMGFRVSFEGSTGLQIWLFGRKNFFPGRRENKGTGVSCIRPLNT